MGQTLKNQIVGKSKKVRLSPRPTEENRVGLPPVFYSRHAHFEKQLTLNQLRVLTGESSNQYSFSSPDIAYIQKHLHP